MSSPDLIERSIPFLIYFVIVVLTNYFFSIYSKKIKATGKKFIAVIFPIWIIITFLKMLTDYIYNPNFKIYLDFKTFAGLLAFNLPLVLIFGGITFYFKQKKYKNH
jgi:hypothetical protein